MLKEDPISSFNLYSFVHFALVYISRTETADNSVSTGTKQQAQRYAMYYFVSLFVMFEHLSSLYTFDTARLPFILPPLFPLRHHCSQPIRRQAVCTLW